MTTYVNHIEDLLTKVTDVALQLEGDLKAQKRIIDRQKHAIENLTKRIDEQVVTIDAQTAVGLELQEKLSERLRELSDVRRQLEGAEHKVHSLQVQLAAVEDESDIDPPEGETKVSEWCNVCFPGSRLNYRDRAPHYCKEAMTCPCKGPHMGPTPQSRDAGRF